VLELLAHRLGNQAIATRLFISPRTVEKHVASLMAKTRQPNRVALTIYALTAFRHEGLGGLAGAEPAPSG
jgi:DNA-binding NarL/FixJ family response regulator